MSSIASFEGGLEQYRTELSESGRVVLLSADESVSGRLQAALERRNLSLFPFVNTPLFEEWASLERVAVLIVDINVPGGGLPFLERLRREDPLAEIIVLALNPDSQLAVQCLELGAQDLIPLPLERTDLVVSRVASAFERWRRGAIDEYVTGRFRDFAKDLFRPKEVEHRGAVDRFSDMLRTYKGSLKEPAQVLYLVSNPYTGERTRAVLESEGYRVTMVAGVKEAVAAAEKMEPRLLLAEAQVGDGTAFDAYREIARLQPDMEFLVVSPANAVDVALMAMENGARDCILKPHEGMEAILQKSARALRLQAQHLKHARLVDELRRLCTELVRIDQESKSVMIKVDPGRSQATLNRMMAELHREEQKRLRKSA